MNNDKLLGYLEAKLEGMHGDIRRLQTQVEQLEADFNKRKGVHSIMVWGCGIVGSAIGYIINHLYK